MTDPHTRWRVSVCLTALVVASAWPAVAEAQQVDNVVKQQQVELEQLKSSLAQANKDTAALQRRIEDVEKNPASPEAWKTLQMVGLTFVGVWGGVALFREWCRSKDAQAQTKQETIKAVTELLREANRQQTSSGAATIRNAAFEYVERVLLGSRIGPSKEQSDEAQ